MYLGDVMGYIAGGLLVIAVAIVNLVLYLAVILLCGWAIEWVLDMLGIGIDRTIYWTGIGLLILFCAFGKTKVEKGD